MQAPNWSRRQFLFHVSATGTALILNPLLPSWTNEGYDPRIAKIVAKTIGIDTHNHIDVPLSILPSGRPQIDLVGDMKKSGLSAICMTFAVDYQKLTKEGEAFERFMNGLDALDEALKSNKINRAFTIKDIKKAHKKQYPTVIQSVEGGHFLEGHIERLEIAYKRGLRCLGLLHDNDASVPLGDIYTKPPQWSGLTDFGVKVIKECNKLGILIDLTHCSNDAINAALKVTTKPVVITHTGLDTQLGQNEKMAKMMLPRLISKEQAKIVADAKGIIGVWRHLSDTPLEYAQNIRAMVDVVGIDHVCIGTDTKLTTPYRPPQNADKKPENGSETDKKPQNPPPPNAQQGPRIGERTNLAWKDQTEGFYFTVVDALLKTGFNEDEIGKIAGDNFCRVFEAATS